MKLSIQSIPDNSYVIGADDNVIGTVRTHWNPAHNRNAYLSLEFDSWPHEISRELFQKFRKGLGAPLQVMTASYHTQTVEFLKAGGFRRVRRCYAREFYPDDSKYPLSAKIPLQTAREDSPEYEACAAQLFLQYQKKHERINPLTEDYEMFKLLLPDTVYYEGSTEQIHSFAFVEDNEIAYVGTTVPEDYLDFIVTVVAALFLNHQTICFEADDCDWEAMTLKDLFNDDPDDWDDSYDTYIYE